jgi:hypothetical protein
MSASVFGGAPVVAKIIELPEGLALLLDRDLLRRAGLGPGAEVLVSAQGKGLLLTPAEAPFDAAFLEAAERGLGRYEDTFRRLAE